MKRILHTILALCLSVMTYGQTNPKVKEMTNQRAKIEQEISESQRLPTSAKKDVDGQLAQLSALTAQIKKQQRLQLITQQGDGAASPTGKQPPIYGR